MTQTEMFTAKIMVQDFSRWLTSLLTLWGWIHCFLLVSCSSNYNTFNETTDFSESERCWKHLKLFAQLNSIQQSCNHYDAEMLYIKSLRFHSMNEVSAGPLTSCSLFNIILSMHKISTQAAFITTCWNWYFVQFGATLSLWAVNTNRTITSEWFEAVILG